MNISFEQIKELRAQTGMPILECKNVLEETGGDFEQALKILKERGAKIAQDIAVAKSREGQEGTIAVYLHQNQKIGAMVELHCQTDFVARSQEFQYLAKELAMHIAAMNPRYLKPEDIPREDLQEFKDLGAKVEELCLLTQSYIRDPAKTIEGLINEYIARFGENITVERFVRYSL